ncbi:MAG TPA: hypothetical protein DC047_18040 [Blastocatellia bacterium]|nr:hypothetical protein [Blastocatellia bacterium]
MGQSYAKEALTVIRLDVIGTRQSAERAAAESLKRLMEEFWIGIEEDPDSDVRILVDINCPGQRVEDIDIVVLAVFAKPREIIIPALDDGTELGRFLLGSLCAVIEVKGHRRDSVKFDGDRLCVRYDDDWHDATRQSGQQAPSLVHHLERRGVTPPYVYKFIWLRNVSQEEMAQGRSANNPLPHNLLFSDSSMGSLLTSVWIQWQAKHPNTQVLYGDKLLIGSDRHTRTPADLNGISQTLTGQKMTLLPARATSVVRAEYRSHPGRLHSNASKNQHSRGRTGLSFVSLVRSSPVLLFLTLVIVGSSLIGIQRLLAWIRPAVQTSRQSSLELAPFEGKYKCYRKSETYVLTIGREGDRLYAGSVKGRIELLPVHGNEFRGAQDLGGSRGTFAFNRNAKGKVVSLTINGGAGQKSVCQPLE